MDFSFRLFGHKYFEFQLELGKWDWEWFYFSAGTRTRQDHGGAILRLEFLRNLYIGLTVYDNRHWNVDAGRWYQEGEGDKSDISEETLVEYDFEKKAGLPLFNHDPTQKTLDFYSKAVLVKRDPGISAVYLHIWQDPETGVWQMTDNWTKLIADVWYMTEVDNWENFVKNKRLV